jgi:hypothetical protein
MRNPFAGRGRYALAYRLAPLILFAAALGCGPGQGTVSGQVKLTNGKPLPGGWITFVPADPRQPPATARIDENGRYELTVAAGKVKILVDNRELEAQAAQGPAAPVLPEKIKLPADLNVPKPAPGQGPPPDAPEKLPGKYVRIDPKYHTVEKSGLEYTVSAGPQTHDVELK